MNWAKKEKKEPPTGDQSVKEPYRSKLSLWLVLRPSLRSAERWRIFFFWLREREKEHVLSARCDAMLKRTHEEEEEEKGKENEQASLLRRNFRRRVSFHFSKTTLSRLSTRFPFFAFPFRSRKGSRYAGPELAFPPVLGEDGRGRQIIPSGREMRTGGLCDDEKVSAVRDGKGSFFFRTSSNRAFFFFASLLFPSRR